MVPIPDDESDNQLFCQEDQLENQNNPHLV